MATVYRMENKQHHGPFSPDGISDYSEAKDMWKNVPWIEVSPDGLTTKDSVDDKAYPNHFTDVLGLSKEDMYVAEYLHIPLLQGQWAVGCDSLQQFYHWFPKQSLADFARHGMLLDVYDVPDSDVRKGKWQVMFEPSKAKLVKSEPLTALVH